MEPLPEDCYTRPINLPEGKVLSGARWTLLRACQSEVELNLYFLLSFSDHAAAAASAARLPACGGVSAPPKTQTPPDEALTALQGQHHFRLLMFHIYQSLSFYRLYLHESFFFFSFFRNASTTWASQSLILLQSSLKFSWWLCECCSSVWNFFLGEVKQFIVKYKCSLVGWLYQEVRTFFMQMHEHIRWRRFSLCAFSSFCFVFRSLDIRSLWLNVLWSVIVVVC